MSYKYSLKLRLISNPDIFLGGYGSYLTVSEDKKTLTMKVRGTDRTFQRTNNEREYLLVDNIGDDARSISLTVLDTINIKNAIEAQKNLFDMELEAIITCPDGTEYSVITLIENNDAIYIISANDRAFEHKQCIVHDQYRADENGIHWVYSSERLTKENNEVMLFNLASLKEKEHYPPVNFDRIKPRVCIPCNKEHFAEVAPFINYILPEGFNGTLMGEVGEITPLVSTDIIVNFSQKLPVSGEDETQEYVINGICNIDGYKMEVLEMAYNHKENRVDYQVMLRRHSRVHALFAILKHFRDKDNLSMNSLEFVLEDKHNKVTFVLYGKKLNRVKVIKERNPVTFGKHNDALTYIGYAYSSGYGAHYITVNPEENNEPGKVVFNIRPQVSNNLMVSADLPLESYIGTTSEKVDYWRMYIRGIFQLAGVRSVEPHWLSHF